MQITRGAKVRLLRDTETTLLPKKVAVGTEGEVLGIRNFGVPEVLVKFKGRSNPRSLEASAVEVLS